MNSIKILFCLLILFILIKLLIDNSYLFKNTIEGMTSNQKLLSNEDAKNLGFPGNQFTFEAILENPSNPSSRKGSIK